MLRRPAAGQRLDLLDVTGEPDDARDTPRLTNALPPVPCTSRRRVGAGSGGSRFTC